MVLTKSEETKIKKDFSREGYEVKKQTATLNTDEIIAAAKTLDTFMTDNIVKINNVLPLRFQSIATQQQKLKLLKIVVSQLELK